MFKPVQGGLSDLRMAVVMNDARHIPFNTEFYIEVDNERVTVVRSKSVYDNSTTVGFRQIARTDVIHNLRIFLSVEQLRAYLLPKSEHTPESTKPQWATWSPTRRMPMFDSEVFTRAMIKTHNLIKPTFGMVEIKKECVYRGARYKIGTLKMLAEAERYGHQIPMDTVFICVLSNQPVMRTLVSGCTTMWRFLSDPDNKPHLIELNKLTIIKE
jgi:hypothetical protein